MKKQNKEGPAILTGLPEPQPMRLADVASQTLSAESDPAVILDTRASHEEFLASHLAGSLHAPLGSSLAVVAGSYVEEGTPMILVADAQDVEAAVRTLVRIGLDNAVGYVTPDQVRNAPPDMLRSIDTLSFEELPQRLAVTDGQIVDVRGIAEYRQDHLPGAQQLAHTRLAARLDELSRETPLFVHCASGRRASFAVAELAREGFDVTYVGGMFPGSQAYAELQSEPVEAGG